MTESAGTSPALAEPPLDALESLLRGRRSVVLAGAGCSTESGIPDYRGPEGRLRVRSPVQYNDFVRSEATRRRYWGRSTVGWSRMVKARPNAAHQALAELEDAGLVSGLITQNVDGLHQAAGSRRVIELHGSLDSVVCLSCAHPISRSAMQERLVSANPEWIERVAEGPTPMSAPDGDAEVESVHEQSFVVPACDGCGGILKPDVVFFGENVPRPRVDEAWAMVDDADVLLVVGSSLTVFSGRRFVYGARDREMPIAILNLGPTRGDELATAKVEGRLGEVMPRLVRALS